MSNYYTITHTNYPAFTNHTITKQNVDNMQLNYPIAKASISYASSSVASIKFKIPNRTLIGEKALSNNTFDF